MSRGQIILSLYDKAIKHCTKAIETIEGGPLTMHLKGEHIGRMQDIVIELNSSLDFEIGGDTAKELSALYDYLLFESTQSNIKSESEGMRRCRDVLQILFDGWKEAIKTSSRRSTDEIGEQNDT